MFHSETKRRLLGFGRVALVLLLLALLSAGIGVRTARAQLGERLLGFGSELARWEGFRFSTAPRRLSVNGAELELVVASTKLSVSEALDRLEAVCSQAGGVVGVEAVAKLLKSQTPSSRSWLNGHVRRESAREGVLGCLDTGGPLGLEELAARLQAVSRTGDLSELGKLRYVTLRRAGNVTTVLFLWSDGKLPLLRMFPKDGDAPGIDPMGVPRPVGARRLLSGVEHGMPYSLSVYRAPASSPAVLIEWYRAALRSGGFDVTDAADGSLLARQRERTFVIHAARAQSGVAAAVAEMK